MTKSPVEICGKMEGIKHNAWFRNERSTAAQRNPLLCFPDNSWSPKMTECNDQKTEGRCTSEHGEETQSICRVFWRTCARENILDAMRAMSWMFQPPGGNAGWKTKLRKVSFRPERFSYRYHLQDQHAPPSLSPLPQADLLHGQLSQDGSYSQDQLASLPEFIKINRVTTKNN